MDSCSLAVEHEHLPYSVSMLEFLCGILILRILVISKHQNLGFIHFQWWGVTAEERMVKALLGLKRMKRTMSMNKTWNLCGLKHSFAIPTDSQIRLFSFLPCSHNPRSELDDPFLISFTEKKIMEFVLFLSLF